MIDFLKEKDPIMKEIKKTKEKYVVPSVNATIIGNSIISGKNGKTINYNESYNKMKKYGTYNESLTTLKETTPVISIEDNYDKYLIGGNKNNKNISLVFIVTKDTNINNILTILDNKNVSATFFIDGEYLEDNTRLIKSMNEHEIEILSYNNSYNESFFKTSISYLENTTSKKVKYCYTRYDNEELLKLCSKEKLHTIKPTIYLDKNIYKGIKNNLDNSIIISLDINNYVERELSSVIDHIREKGYKLVTIDNLVKENY